MEHIVTCKAKINLSLDIVSKREDGYHNLKMILHTVDLFDTLKFKENNSGKISICTNLRYLPCDQKNIVFKAYEAFYEKTGLAPQGFLVHIQKKIPVSAGLGGGSSDAAGTLTFLNRYHGEPLSLEELLQTGKTLGADVPYCIIGGTCVAEGIGDILRPISSLPPCHIVIAKPQNRGLSTRRIFSMVQLGKIKYHPDTSGLEKALLEGDLKGICQRMYNVLEEYSMTQCSEITKYKSMMLDGGAIGTLMSGSGNAVFGIFEDASLAEQTYRSFLKLTENAYFLPEKPIDL